VIETDGTASAKAALVIKSAATESAESIHRRKVSQAERCRIPGLYSNLSLNLKYTSAVHIIV